MLSSMPEARTTDSGWQRFAIRGIEDLANATLGAEIEAIQMPGPPVGGSLAFDAVEGIAWSSGRIEGSVLLRGRIAEDALTVVVILRAGHGARLWMRPAGEGSIGVVLPGDVLDAYLTAGSVYLAATLTVGRAGREARRAGLDRVPASLLGGGLLPGMLDAGALGRARAAVEAVHAGGSAGACGIGWLVKHAAMVPPGGSGGAVAGLAGLVHAADERIRRDLGAPVSTAALAEAAGTSPRTLYRAFAAVFGDTPQGYVRRLRLHRVRARLLAPDEPATTVTRAAERLGFEHDMGRLSVRYRALFGETPSATLARRRARERRRQL